MELLYLGTAAAEGIPALFCTCEMCAYARRVRGKEVRGRAGALLDGVLKLDFGPDSFKQMLDNDLDYTHMRSLLVTHAHEDHFAIGDISTRRKGFAQLPEDEPALTVYGNGKVGEMVKPFLSKDLAFEQMKAFEPRQIEGYTVTALEGVHCLSSGSDAGWPVVFENRAYQRSEEAFIYLIEKNGESLLYAHDTDELTPADLEYLAERRIDLVSLDCTNGKLHCDYIGHMGADDCLRMREKLLSCGAADEHTVFVANHFSHNGVASYEQLQAMMPGFVISYDGMKIETPKK